MKTIFFPVLLDLILGDPYSFPHPVKLMGRIIKLEEDALRKTKLPLKFAGFIIASINILLSFFVPFSFLKLLAGHRLAYFLVNTYLIYSCIAARCLDQEAMKVYQALDQGLDKARYQLSFIVGRDTERLDEEEVIKACIETVAENTSDGVIAPLFYIVLLGAPGGLMYKMVNTMDSMLGYKNEKYRDLGYFPAKIDDVFNYLPARICGGLMCLASAFRFDMENGFRIMLRDRKNHASPNAAYPEGAVAGLLGIELGGASKYHGRIVDKPTLGDRTRAIEKDHIKKTIEIMYRGEFLFLVFYGIYYYGKFVL